MSETSERVRSRNVAARKSNSRTISMDFRKMTVRDVYGNRGGARHGWWWWWWWWVGRHGAKDVAVVWRRRCTSMVAAGHTDL